MPDGGDPGNGGGLGLKEKAPMHDVLLPAMTRIRDDLVVFINFIFKGNFLFFFTSFASNAFT